LHGKGVDYEQIDETFLTDSLLEAKSQWVTRYVRSTDTPVKRKKSRNHVKNWRIGKRLGLLFHHV
jgi:hypothetical protein